MKTALRALRDELLAEQKEKEVRGFKGIVHLRVWSVCLPWNTKGDVLKVDLVMGTEAFKFQN